MSCNKANFMEHLAHNGNWQSTDIKTVDHAAHRVAIEGKERMRAASDGPVSISEVAGSDWRKNYEIMNRYHRINTERGSMTKRPGDACEHY